MFDWSKRSGVWVWGVGSVWTLCALLGLASWATAPTALADENPRPAVARDVLTVDVTGQRGGRLVVGLRAEPKTFNPVLARDNPSRTVIRRLVADLVHIDRVSQDTGPALAKSWTVSEDGRRFRVELRRGLRFSDGHPLDADDVVFTFQVYLDPAIGSPNRDLLVIDDKPLAVRRVDAHTVELELGGPYAVGDRLFDSIAILPKHRLEKAYAAGTFTEVWGLGTAPEEIVGLGPFRLKEYAPGERVILERNPHYWKVDRRGQPLPYLDELVFLFVGSPEAQVLRFKNGDTHVVDGLGAEDFALLEGDAARRNYRLEDLGPGLSYSFLVFNANPAPEGSELAHKQTWFRQKAFRQAISRVIDRQSIVRLVYRGRATPSVGPESAGNKLWLNRELKPLARSPEAATRLLGEAGFVRRDNGSWADATGKPLKLNLVTSSSNSQRLRMATIIQEDLRKFGIPTQVVPMEFRALVERLLETFDYEVCLLALGGADSDPNGVMGTWLSSGGNHFWHLGQTSPATPWEAEIDRLMTQQLVTLDYGERKALYDRVQRIAAEQLPFIFLVSPNVLVGARQGLGNFKPAILDHPTLWNVEELHWQGTGGR